MDVDDFDPSPSRTQGGATDPLVDNEYARLQQRYSDAGYREGIGEGKLATLQAGFDEGFASTVPPARAVGQLRGRAAALLAIALESNHTKSTSRSIQSKSSQADQAKAQLDAQANPPNAQLDTVRTLVADLAAVRRDDILAPDAEAIAHEAEHHDDDDAFEYDRNEKRDMEALEAGMAVMAGKEGKNGLREQALLDELERRVAEAEAAVLA
ncbi:hypothetical protein CspeluHIS016_0406560 [Cutaneotrichosporon spelunceum]|uniref:Protein YAE1 n=1 Tax=Cutaneotrichosporon spelunceum TaxID=1672016 RepID=A0AAD3TWR1_9TREE|nr:hypothetical protein CspeluHIS016_0406560 [Cutaneotrichosporon spelunceum]